MMQPISQVQPPLQTRRAEIAATEPVQAAAETKTSSDNATGAEEQKEKNTFQSTQDQHLREERLSQETLDEISRDLETLHAVGLNFTRHDETGRTMVRITNRDTDEVIREIPAEQVLDLAAKIEEMVGLIFDEKV